jgi:hypothetical protein
MNNSFENFVALGTINDFEDFVTTRCERALQECEEYLQREYDGSLSPDELQVKAEELCYKKGLSDAISIFVCNLNCGQIS